MFQLRYSVLRGHRGVFLDLPGMVRHLRLGLLIISVLVVLQRLLSFALIPLESSLIPPEVVDVVIASSDELLGSALQCAHHDIQSQCVPLQGVLRIIHQHNAAIEQLLRDAQVRLGLLLIPLRLDK